MLWILPDLTLIMHYCLFGTISVLHRLTVSTAIVWYIEKDDRERIPNAGLTLGSVWSRKTWYRILNHVINCNWSWKINCIFETRNKSEKNMSVKMFLLSSWWSFIILSNKIKEISSTQVMRKHNKLQLKSMWFFHMLRNGQISFFRLLLSKVPASVSVYSYRTDLNNCMDIFF